MIIGMPAVSFFAYLCWPVIFIAAAIIVYIVMRKQDAEIDDEEFEQALKGRKGVKK
ncbi:MAG: hypothetical protein FWF29_09940 [Treponema sp.]|nr:hypothetical protein [Treponema sp.]